MKAKKRKIKFSLFENENRFCTVSKNQQDLKNFNFLSIQNGSRAENRIWSPNEGNDPEKEQNNNF